ncbi:RodZ family helix-turn-helix domain-containing protein [Denitrificimonas sp. JX-1]|uniref:RodZ family helix-turn-helix domain-containing protein n=1 Tax=Denitrificimonas halotolerans TaxID=3098930 RepID=A0ABU5GSH6_9GAMM|nr:RodZ family helix-turn-helix domain-containing protein [Denitrificimonas sp. JX-1]MDY7219935.1 RodZ family helix-turn-helix domain-containing protein [Denitrificimonas sp. JX-1]
MTLATNAQPETVGDSLRNARLTAGWAISDVAKKLHLTESTVQSIESDQFERLPGTTFSRGYIRSYAKLLGLDEARMAQQFDQQIGTSADTHSVQSIDRVGESRRVSRGMFQFSLLVILLIIFTAAYYGWQAFSQADSKTDDSIAAFERVEIERADGSLHVQTLDESDEITVPSTPSANIARTEDASEMVELAVKSSTQEAMLKDNAVLVEGAVTELLSEAEAVVAVAGTDVESESEVDAVPELELASGMGHVELNFTDDCWIRIVDASGKEVKSGLQRAGDSVSITAQPPLNVRLGYAKGVSIIYNGEPVDFSSSIRGATARFKLGE